MKTKFEFPMQSLDLCYTILCRAALVEDVFDYVWIAKRLRADIPHENRFCLATRPVDPPPPFEVTCEYLVKVLADRKQWDKVIEMYQLQPPPMSHYDFNLLQPTCLYYPKAPPSFVALQIKIAYQCLNSDAWSKVRSHS